MSEWSDRVAPQAARLLANDARDGASFLSQQIQEMQQSGHGREALELVDKTRFLESGMPQDQYSGHIETGHQQYNNGWMYENVAVNGQTIASIPERPMRQGIPLPEIIIAAGVTGLIAGLMHRGGGNYYENRGQEHHRPLIPQLPHLPIRNPLWPH